MNKTAKLQVNEFKASWDDLLLAALLNFVVLKTPIHWTEAGNPTGQIAFAVGALVLSLFAGLRALYYCWLLKSANQPLFIKLCLLTITTVALGLCLILSVDSYRFVERLRP